MEERRRLSRHTVFRSAKIVFHDQASLIDCIVRNLTNNGACLHFEAAIHAPERFDLSFDNFRSVRICHVLWRQVDRLGVKFFVTASDL